MNYKVIAPCVDRRTGATLSPGDVMKDPTPEQVQRLIMAKCITAADEQPTIPNSPAAVAHKAHSRTYRKRSKPDAG